MAEEILTGNPIITTASGSAWITKDESVKINSIRWFDLTSGVNTIAFTNGGVTTTLSNILLKRATDSAAISTYNNGMELLTEPIVVSRFMIHSSTASTRLEIWKD
jgi:hypothetical protein